MPGFAASKSGCLIVLVLAALGWAPAAVAQEEDAAAVVAFSDGVRAFNEGHDQEAREHFDLVLKRHPQNGTAHYWLGLTLLRLGRPVEALDQIQQSLREGAALQVDPLWAQHDLGGAQLAAGDASAAVSTLAAVATAVEKRLQKNRSVADRAHRRVDQAKSRHVSPERLDELEWEAESRLHSLKIDEKLLARTLLRQSEALDRLGQKADAAAARAKAAELAPELREAEIEAPPWEGRLPSFGELTRPWNASVGLTTLSDSNPSLLSEGLSLGTPDAGVRLFHGGESDQAAQLDLALTLRPSRDLNGWSLGAIFNGHQSFYQALDFFNSGELRAVAYLARGGAPRGYLSGPLGPVRVALDSERRFSLLLAGGVDYTTLDGSGYLTTTEGSASVLYRPSRRWASQVDLHLLDRSFREEPAVGRRSGTEVRLGLSQTWFGGRDASLTLGALGGRRSAGLPFEASLLRGSAELAVLFHERFGLNLSGSWQKDTYSDPQSDLFFFSFVYDPYDPKFGPLEKDPKLRRDTTLRAGAALSWALNSNVRLTSRLAWIDRDSNLVGRFVTLDYRRTILSLGASWLF